MYFGFVLYNTKRVSLVIHISNTVITFSVFFKEYALSLTLGFFFFVVQIFF